MVRNGVYAVSGFMSSSVTGIKVGAFQLSLDVIYKVQHGIKVEVHIPGSNKMCLQVGMAALLDKADQMASMDWRVAPVPWRESLASPGRPLKVPLQVK